MEDKILKFATAVVVVLTVAVCIGLPFFPQIHTWAVESREERLAEQEYAENQTEMKDLEIVAADTSVGTAVAVTARASVKALRVAATFLNDFLIVSSSSK